jgi:ligand-binding SRPBCC domain-containing protein
MPIIELNTKIKAAKEIVFDLSRSIDLHTVSAKQTNEKAVAGKTTGLIGLNESVTWRAKHLGVYHKLTSKVTVYDRPHYFVDEMINGPFKELKHEHHFSDVNGVTLMVDCFEYKAPLGILGTFADKLFLKNYMTEFLKKRNQIIKEVAESNKWKKLLR